MNSGKLETKIGLIGLGTVGRGIAEMILRKNVEGLKLARIAEIDAKRWKGAGIPKALRTGDFMDIINDPEIDTVVELIGGIGVARKIAVLALEKGKNLVTANKHLIAVMGEELFDLARSGGQYLGFRASAVGCFPVMEFLSRVASSGKKPKRVYAVLNGTSNFVLTEMEKKKIDFADAIIEARRMGYAEADPSLDIDGHDTLHKMCVVTNLIYGAADVKDRIHREGIGRVRFMDIQYARELGYRVKLLGVIEDLGGEVSIRVHPALFPTGQMLASLEGINNGIEIQDEYGDITGFFGPGAGAYPAASAVMHDLLDISLGREPFIPSGNGNLKLAGMERVSCRYYMRLNVDDRAGVLARISKILWKYDISIAAVLQKDKVDKNIVPVVLMTHVANEKKMMGAFNEIGKLKSSKPGSIIIRVIG